MRKLKVGRGFAALGFGLCLMSYPAAAQPAVPSPADPAPPGQPLPPGASSAADPSTPSPTSSPFAPPLDPRAQKKTLPQDLVEWQSELENTTADSEKRMVKHFVVEGSRLVREDEMRRVLRGYEGKALTLSQMKGAARDLTALYQKHGYYLVKAIVPAQDFNSGDIKIHVIEGKIGKVTVEGAKHYDPKFIKKRFMQSLKNGNFHSDEFTRAMLLLNEQPDLRVKAVLMPGADPGTADVVLKVEDQNTLHFGLDFNNYGTIQTGQNRIGLNMDAGNLISQADQFSLRGVVGLPSDHGTDFFQAQYLTPVDQDGTVVTAGYANGAFSVSQGLAEILDIRGSANIYTVGFSRPLDRDLDFSDNIGVTFAHKDIRNNFFGGAEPFSKDEYTESRVTYQADWRQSSGRTIFQAAWTQGLGGNSSENDPLTSRVGAGGTFAHFNFDLGRIQNLTDGLYGVVRGSAQLATAPLYVAEQYAMGGPDTVRGYPQAALLGDNGYLVSAELRWSTFPKIKDKFQTVFFIDHGGVTDNHLVAGDLPYGNQLTGAGFGFRYSFSSESNIRVDVGFPISPVNTPLERGPAVYTGLQTRF
jgi:hemolysin activation/secretion protein